MLKNKVALEVKVNGRDVSLYCDVDCPLTDLYNAHEHIGVYILGRIQKANQTPKQESLPVVEVKEHNETCNK